MQNVVDLKNSNIYKRIFSGLNISILLTIFIVFLTWNQNYSLNIPLISIIVYSSPISFFLIIHLWQLKHYIIKIEYSTEGVYFEYFAWLTLKKDFVKKTNLTIQLKGAYPYGIKLVIGNSGRIFLQQYKKSLLSSSDWSELRIQETFSRLKVILDDVKLNQTKMIEK